METVTDYVTTPIGQIFLRLLFMLVIPLLFSALVVGISEMGEVRSLKRVGLRTLAYTVLVSSIAVLVSLAAVNLLAARRRRRPARAPPLLAEQGERASRSSRPAGSSRGHRRLRQHHPQQSGRGDGQTTARSSSVMFFALFFGIGLLLTDTPAARALKTGFEGLFDVTMRLIVIVIRLAPLAVACFMFNLAALFGWELLARLSAYVGVVLLALAHPDVRRLPARCWRRCGGRSRSPSSARRRKRA